MLKNFSKILLLMLLVFVVSSSFFNCFADEEHDHTNTVTTTQTGTTGENVSDTPEIHSGDLYLLGFDVVMDKAVDGNVFIIGNTVEITGQINGDLYVIANKLSFNECIINYSIFACANSVYYNGGCYKGDLYVTTNNLETTYNSYVARDIKAIASKVTLKSAVGRDIDLFCDSLDLGSGEDIPLIYGNLRYTANNETTVPEGVFVGEGNAIYSKQYFGNSITGILLGFATCIITVFAVFVAVNKLTPSFVQKVHNNKFTTLSILKAFGIGLASIVIIGLLIAVLACTVVGISLSVILGLLFAILCIIATPILVIKIANVLKTVFKINKTFIHYLVVALVSVVLNGITYIPFAGIILTLIIKVIAIGFIVDLFLPHKELSEEEKNALEEAKKIAKEHKEKAKQEKLKIKAEKQAKKAEIKKK